VRGALLFVLLAAVYFFFFSGVAVSNDEVQLWDGVHSFVQQGNLWLNYSGALRLPGNYPSNAPVPTLDSEPGQVLAAAPFFVAALWLPGLGLVQTVWLLNVVLTALTGTLIYHYARLLGYETRTAIGATLLFGLATIAFPYSKTFFREPLLGVLLLICAYCLERWRRAGWRWLLPAVAALFGAFLTKDAAILILPVLLVIVLPPIRKVNRRSLLTVVGLVVVALVVTILLSRVVGGRFDIAARLNHLLENSSAIPDALAGFLISPGRSIFAFSPALLLALPGGLILLRRGAVRLLLVAVTALLSFVCGYALLQNVNWYGGTAWGPRYMVPLTPYLALLTLPALQSLPRARLPAKIVAGMLIAGSAALQTLAILIPLGDYYRFLEDEGARLGRSLVGWIAGTWDLAYIPQTVLPRLLGKVSFDLAWDVNRAAWVGVACLVLVLCAALALRRPGRFNGLALLMALLLVCFAGLRAAGSDPRYGGNDPAASRALQAVEQATRPGETAMLLGSNAYRAYFMNNYRGRAPIFQLHDPPGEVDVPGRPLRMTISPLQLDPANLDARVDPATTTMLPRIAALASRWLYITEFRYEDRTRTRALENYLVRHYFPIREVLTTDTVRIIEFSAQDAPPDNVPPWPLRSLNAPFGKLLTFIGADLPEVVKRGAVLPVSLLWRFEGWSQGADKFDYSVNISLIAPDVGTVAQRSGTPQGTFGRMSEWVAGGFYRDNHALEVPNKPGEYEIWIVVYDWRDNTRLPVARADHLVLASVRVE